MLLSLINTFVCLGMNGLINKIARFKWPILDITTSGLTFRRIDISRNRDFATRLYLRAYIRMSWGRNFSKGPLESMIMR